ncbi:kinase-like domain-containing protein [Mycena leptocephala]|nr:kinase-like domain-containing protein [Mycena leptocephala]
MDLLPLARPLFCKALLRLSRKSGVHPRCFHLSEMLTIGQPVAVGGFGDVCKGVIQGQAVAVKVMRVFEDSDIEAVLKEFGREALIWRQLSHPNLLPFFGIYHLDTRLCLISPWMENGHVMHFLKKNPHLAEPNRLSLILDVAFGLRYLHQHKIVHGDLKAVNILVTPSFKACIADFGLSAVNTRTLPATQSTVDFTRGTPRYLAPELLLGERESLGSNLSSDVYAFAYVGYEILTGNIPFYNIKNDAAVIIKVIARERPRRLPPCSGSPAYDTLWDLLRSCWTENMSKRPTASEIVERLEGPLIRATTISSIADWDATFTSKFRRSLHVKTDLPSVPQIHRMIFGDSLFGEMSLISSSSS